MRKKKETPSIRKYSSGMIRKILANRHHSNTKLSMSAAQGNDFNAVTGGLQRTTRDRREAVVEKQGEMLGREKGGCVAIG